MAQRQFRSDDTSTWNDRFGDGSDSSYAPSTSTDAPVDSACTGTASTTSLSATNVSFAGGQLILIHQTQGTGAGKWELNKIASYTAGTITTSYSLINSYTSGAQVLVLKKYSSISIGLGVTLTGKAWNGTVGGVTALLCNGSITITGTIAAGSGFIKGTKGASDTQSTQGEGTTGTGSASSAANGNGGGGGIPGTSDGGGGGGNGAAGTTPTSGASGGNAVGSVDLITIELGGGGGGGANGTNGLGANGSGIIILIAKTITVTGSMTSTGSTGQDSAGTGGGGGGGAGGSILLKGQSIVLGSTLVTAAGGGGGAGSGGRQAGGAGGVGRIHADYSISLSGTTSPSIDTRLDTSLSDASGLFDAMI